MHESYTPIAINSRIETEEVLGPLPDNWEKSPWGKTGRYFFVDHNTKNTTWVDPRTYHLRKHDIKEIVAGELPYAWEEVFDHACGIYYIDHITQSHFLDAPWEEHVRNQVLNLQNQLSEENKILELQLQKEKEKKQELEAAEQKYRDLTEKRAKLEMEIKELEGNVAGKNSAAVSDELRGELQEVTQQLQEEKVEVDNFNDEHERLQKEIDAYQVKLRELRAVNEKLQQDNEYLAENSKQQNDGLIEMRNMIEMEAAQRAALEQYIKQLKMEVIQLYNPEEADKVKQLEEENEANADELIVDAPLPESGVLAAEEELMKLRERLQEERDERERLKKVTETLEAERSKVQMENESSGLYALPTWIKELNVSQSQPASSTLRIKISKMKENPDAMGFGEKLMMFEHQANGGKTPHGVREEIVVLANAEEVDDGEVEEIPVVVEAVNDDLDLEDEQPAQNFAQQPAPTEEQQLEVEEQQQPQAEEQQQPQVEEQQPQVEEQQPQVEEQQQVEVQQQPQVEEQQPQVEEQQPLVEEQQPQVEEQQQVEVQQQIEVQQQVEEQQEVEEQQLQVEEQQEVEEQQPQAEEQQQVEEQPQAEEQQQVEEQLHAEEQQQLEVGELHNSEELQPEFADQQNIGQAEELTEKTSSEEVPPLPTKVNYLKEADVNTDEKSTQEAVEQN
ncbi:Membrane-associated guanylate kinase, WW and PDZ domain-containing protein 3 [Lobulomyces angularis]|nr:Membrane-associated guanylate kinase, WW and PDZ domain-containing protein 3 [Lobulomyces angularis]